jgi:hypothetical protein
MTDRLEDLARQLGARAAERLDVQTTARKVVERLREEPARRTVWIHETWLRVAAAVVIVVGGAFAIRQASQDSDTGDHVAHFVADDLNDLSTDQLRDVLATFDEIVAGDSAEQDSSPDLHELDTQQLRALLRAGEG